MQLKAQTDYAIRILRFLHTRNVETLTAMQIALATDITTPTFTQIAMKLKKDDMLKTIQGGQGGYILGKPANEISVYDVLVSIEGELKINHCMESEGLCSHGEEVKCKVHEKLYNLQGEIIEKLSNLYISDLT